MMYRFNVFNAHSMSLANDINNNTVSRQKQKMHITTNAWLTMVKYSKTQPIQYPIGFLVSNGNLEEKKNHQMKMNLLFAIPVRSGLRTHDKYKSLITEARIKVWLTTLDMAIQMYRRPVVQ